MGYDKLVDSAQLDSDLTIVADAIREKGGTTEKLPFPYGMKQAIESIDVRGIPDGYDVYDVTPYYPTFACPAVPGGIADNATNIDAAYLHNMVLSKGDAFYIKLKAYDKLDQSNIIEETGSIVTVLPTPTTVPSNSQLPAHYMNLSVQTPSWINLGDKYVHQDTLVSDWLWVANTETKIGRLSLRERSSSGNVEIKEFKYFKKLSEGGYKEYRITPRSRFVRLPAPVNGVDQIVDIVNLGNRVFSPGDAIYLEVIEKASTYNGTDSLKATGEVISELPTVVKTPKPDYDPVYYMDAGIHGPGFWSNMGYQHANDALTYEFLWIAPRAVQARRITIRERINLLGTEVEVLEFKFYKKRPPIVSGELGTAILGDMVLGDEVN